MQTPRMKIIEGKREFLRSSSRPMATPTPLDRASDVAFARLEAVGGDISRLEEPLQAVVVIYSAQGIIDNGAFPYFFGSDFPDTPPYDLFVEAYRRIGATEVAAMIDQAAAMFPFPQPHLSLEKRRAFMDSLEEHCEFFALGDRVCGNETIWRKLEQYVLDNASAFQGNPQR
jgi:hypothetical protein